VVSDDWSDWRIWPAEREAKLMEVIRQVEEGLHEAIVRRDPETRARYMGALEFLTADLNLPAARPARRRN